MNAESTVTMSEMAKKVVSPTMEIQGQFGFSFDLSKAKSLKFMFDVCRVLHIASPFGRFHRYS